MSGRRLKRYLTFLGHVAGPPESYPRPPYNGRGWRIELERFRYFETADGYVDQKGRPVSGPMGSVGRFEIWRGRKIQHSQPQVVILAPSRLMAQDVLERVKAAHAVYTTAIHIPDEMALAVPEDPSDLEDLMERDYRHAGDWRYEAADVAQAAAIAARCSRSHRLIYSLMRLWVSYRIVGPHWSVFEPGSPTTPTVVRFAAQHVLFAQAIVAAYGAIEELALIPPEREWFRDKTWIPKVREKFETQLSEAGIDADDPFLWTVRGTRTRLEKKRPIGAQVGPRPSWARGPVRDRHVALVDAISRARWLRSGVSAHSTGGEKRVRSLTLVDVHNWSYPGSVDRWALSDLGWASCCRS